MRSIPIWWRVLMVTGWGMLVAPAATELESLRARCEDQARQIRRLEQTNQKLRAATREASTNTPANAPKASSYTVRSGDNLVGIARKAGCSVDKLAQANRLGRSSIIRPGQKLKLPGAATAARVVPQDAADPKATGDVAPAQGKSRPAPDAVATPADAATPAKPHVEAAPASEAKPPAEGPPPAVGPPPAAVKSGAMAPAGPVPVGGAEPKPSKKNHLVAIESELTYGEFAAKYATTIKHLNDLNGLDLVAGTVLAKGSELYVPSAP